MRNEANANLQMRPPEGAGTGSEGGAQSAPSRPQRGRLPQADAGFGGSDPAGLQPETAVGIEPQADR
jgi:hypothetical protein